MNELIVANVLFQAGAGMALMLVAGIAAARQLHGRRSVRHYAMVAQDACTVIELPAQRGARLAARTGDEAQPEAA